MRLKSGQLLAVKHSLRRDIIRIILGSSVLFLKGSRYARDFSTYLNLYLVPTFGFFEAKKVEFSEFETFQCILHHNFFAFMVAGMVVSFLLFQEKNDFFVFNVAKMSPKIAHSDRRQR